MNVIICYKHKGFLTEVKMHYEGTPHTAAHKQVQLHQWEAVKHSPYNPDPAPSDFHLFGPSKRYLPGRHYNTTADVQ
jgi:hypothetical protein